MPSYFHNGLQQLKHEVVMTSEPLAKTSQNYKFVISFECFCMTISNFICFALLHYQTTYYHTNTLKKPITHKCFKFLLQLNRLHILYHNKLYYFFMLATPGATCFLDFLNLLVSIDVVNLSGNVFFLSYLLRLDQSWRRSLICVVDIGVICSCNDTRNSASFNIF